MIKLCLISRNHPRLTKHRMVGWWSYDVPHLDITHQIFDDKIVTLKRNEYKQFDLVVVEDSRLHVQWVGYADIPFAYQIVDSTLSHQHYKHRLEQSLQYDILLIDQDSLKRFPHAMGKYRFSYCVNENLFRPQNKTYDIGFICHFTKERDALHAYLKSELEKRNISYQFGSRVEDYPYALATSKININLNRNSKVRAHRTFDVMATRSLLLTTPIPKVSDEQHVGYKTFLSFEECLLQIEIMLDNDNWKTYAQQAYNHVISHHTWYERSKQLLEII